MRSPLNEALLQVQADKACRQKNYCCSSHSELYQLGVVKGKEDYLKV